MGNNYEVRRKGKTLASFTGESAGNEAFVWLLRNQPQSVHYATKHEGYSIVKETETGAWAVIVGK